MTCTKFRTPIEEIHGSFEISHDDTIVMLGSCFSDSIGSRLDDDGFTVSHNPLGPLYNPASIANVIEHHDGYAENEMFSDASVWHCLDYASRYSSPQVDILVDKVNAEHCKLIAAINKASVAIITFGTTGVYRFNVTGRIVGNCHRLPASMFTRENLSLDDIVCRWSNVVDLLPEKIIFTLSPIRYVADGFAVNSLSKATLRLAIEAIKNIAEEKDHIVDYFPAFEIMNDDLRDYRFYESDMKHPSAVAVDYIYDNFAEAYFSKKTVETALGYRRTAARARHIPKND